MNKMRRLLISTLCVLFLIPVSIVSADSSGKYLCLGNDLSDEQKSIVLDLLDIEEDELDDWEIITVTNAEEHEYLDDYLSSSVIGTYAISSASIETSDTTGITVTTTNINYCTSGMYENALATAGVENASVHVVAPTEITGTAALVGIMKAYEDMTGEEIDDDAKEAATEELVTTGEISESIGTDEAEQLIADVKAEVTSSEDSLSTSELEEIIEESAEKLDITLTDDEIDSIVSLMKKIDDLDLDYEQLYEQAKSIYQELKSNESLWSNIKSFCKTILEAILSLFE